MNQKFRIWVNKGKAALIIHDFSRRTRALTNKLEDLEKQK
jgi:hypothetical protein